MGSEVLSVPICYINGKRHDLPEGRAEVNLLQYLRDVGLTGTKLGCGEGGCGACTVMVSSVGDDGQLLHRSVNACLCPLYAIEGMHVVTVEGIGSSRHGLHPVQERLARAHGSQCGFCTPGFVMSMYSLLRSKASAPSEEEIEENLAGNLCRCTGYRPILDAFKVFAKVEAGAYTEEAIAASLAAGGAASGVANGVAHKIEAGKKGGKLCPSSGRPCDCGAGAAEGSTSDDKDAMYGSTALKSPTGEPIFPPELRKRAFSELALPGPLAAWYRPTSLKSLFQLKKSYPDAKLVVGNTEVGIEMKFKNAQYPVLIGATHVPELNKVESSEAGLTVGASVTLTALLHALRDEIKSRPAYQGSGYRAIAEQLRWFAGAQIRNTASVGGNIVTGSPISDVNPLYMAMGALFTVQGHGTEPRHILANDFFLGYRKVDLAPHEVLVKVFIPASRQHEYVKEFKQAHRRDDDIAIVNAGMRVAFEEGPTGEWLVGQIQLAVGGVAAKTITAPKTEALLTGQPWSEANLTAALLTLAEDVWISPTAPGGMVEFRRSLAASFLFRFFLLSSYQLAADAATFKHSISDTYKSAVKPYERPPARGIQYFSGVPDEDVVGKPYHHMSADMQVSGEAQYVDDIPLPANALHAAFVLSTRPHAKMLSVDFRAATEALGVEGYFGAADVPGDNAIGAIIHDEELFATTEVTCVGQLIGVVVADTEAHARAGARLVRVEYEDLPAILSTTQWVAAPEDERKCFEGFGHRIDLGDVDAEFSSGTIDHVIQGQARVGGQEHFYLEPNCAIVIPRERDEIEAFSSSQCPSKNQEQIHSVLGIPMHKVTVRTKRLGGGFGGKESRAAFVNAAIAVPAWHLRRPVRVVLDRDEDMQIMGQRHAFVGDYKVGFSKEGKIAALDLNLYCNSGNSLDLTVGIMDRALAHSDNSYLIPAVRAIGCCSFTHQASNTAYRGFGGPQGMMVTEMWIDRIARTVSKSPEEVRLLNMYHENDKTHYGQVLDGCQLRPCWQHVMETSDFMKRRAAAEEYNTGNRFRKRGLALIPTKFGISFTTMFLNQGAALVNVYTDGTVLVTHGGVEMGQGLHTKMAQAAAHDLGIPLASVFIAETATDKIPNASPTAASASSDLYGGAVSDACAQLSTRLAPYRAKLGATASFAEVAKAAHMDRVDLSAHGFYKTPDITGFGGNRPFSYFTYGAVASEVELDTLTGDFQVLRTDICMDVGKSMNPAIDIGQVEGGFVQGMGWSCIEELIWGDDDHKWVRPGTLHTRGPGTYKIPTANDIPIDLRVTLLKDAPNGRTPQAHSSKAVGEPPFFLGAAVFFALKEAVYSARADAGHHGWFELDLPCTPERLRMACPDHLSAPFAAHDIRPKLSC